MQTENVRTPEQKKKHREHMRQWRKAHPGHRPPSEVAKYENNEQVQADECKCVECGQVFKKADALVNGFRNMRRVPYRGWCAECRPAGDEYMTIQTSSLTDLA